MKLSPEEELCRMLDGTLADGKMGIKFDLSGTQTTEDLLKQGWDDISLKAADILFDKAMDGTKDIVWDPIWDQLWGHMKEDIKIQVKEQLWDQLWDQIQEQIKNQFWVYFKDEIKDKIGDPSLIEPLPTP